MMLAESSSGKLPTVRSMRSVTGHKKKLLSLISKPTQKQTQELLDFISDHLAAFSQEMNSVNMEIHTGDEVPRRVAAHHMTFAVWQEVARQLCNIQEAGMMKPSSSPSSDGAQNVWHLKIL